MLQTNQARTTTPPPAPNAEFREQLRQTIQDAQAAALAASKDAAQAARDARDAGGKAVPVIAAPFPPTPPGAWTTQPNNDDAIPPQLVDISIAFFIMCAVMVIGWPLARAFGKRIERRGEVAAVNPAMADQLHRIEQAVDTMAVEIERISESQRFMAKLQNAQTPDRAALPADRV
jgi:hypothetical protein